MACHTQKIDKALGSVRRLARHVADSLKMFKDDMSPERLSWYETEFLSKNMDEANRFVRYLAEKEL